jgi:hypothetical protein
MKGIRFPMVQPTLNGRRLQAPYYHSGLEPYPLISRGVNPYTEVFFAMTKEICFDSTIFLLNFALE